MSNTAALVGKINQQVRELPEESLLDLEQFIEFLHFKAQRSAIGTPPKPPLRIVKLGGILKGYDFSPEMLKEARREMWKKYAYAELDVEQR